MPRRKQPKWTPLIDESLPDEYRHNAKQLQNRLAEIGFANPIDAFIQQPDGKLKLKPLNKIPKETLTLIREIVDTPQGQIIKFNNPIPALNTLAKTLGLQEKRIVVEDNRKKYEAAETIQKQIAEHNERIEMAKLEEKLKTVITVNYEDE